MTVVLGASLSPYRHQSYYHKLIAKHLTHFNPTTIRTPSSFSQVLAKASGPASIVALSMTF